ncbi:MAG TPA: hypothetical protein EYN67_06365 [Flavobacteriales bacterium]|nr:hypothetical protein [Flavobacteriales bacterium]
MGKRRNITLEDYIEETTTNIREDRAIAKSLLMEAISDMKLTDSARRELGPIAAKYVENLQRSNEQLVKLTALLQKQRSQQFGLSADDKEQLYDLLNEDQEDDGG